MSDAAQRSIKEGRVPAVCKEGNSPSKAVRDCVDGRQAVSK